MPEKFQKIYLIGTIKKKTINFFNDWPYLLMFCLLNLTSGIIASSIIFGEFNLIIAAVYLMILTGIFVRLDTIKS